MNISEKVYSIIEDVLKEHDITVTISADTKLVEEYALDSLEAIEILVMIETEFNISINDEDLSITLLETPKTLCEYIEKKVI